MPTLAAPAELAPAPFAAFNHRLPYAEHFARLAAHGQRARALGALALHLDAELDAAERLALWQALWTAWQRADADARAEACAALDGRHAQALAALDLGWTERRLMLHIAAATPVGLRSDLVRALLAHHGLQPLDRPEAMPALALLAAEAAVDGPQRLPAAEIERVQRAVLGAAAQRHELLPRGLALLFELALHAADEGTATAALAECLRHGHARLLRPARVGAWLDGSAFTDDEAAARPLQLVPGLQRAWLQPALWVDAAQRAALHAALHRPAARQRLSALDAQLPQRPLGLPVPAEALQALALLDAAYADADADGAPPEPLPHTWPAAPAAAALQRAEAARRLRQGDAEGALRALLQARRLHPTEALRATLDAALPAALPRGGDGAVESEYWQAVSLQPDAAWQRIARLQLATLWTEGMLEPRPLRRCPQRPHAAAALWRTLQAEPAYRAAAEAALAQPAQALLRTLLPAGGDDADHLWVETPGARRVLVVFSCVATHHGFAELPALHGRMPDHHLLFVRPLAKNWYCDTTFGRVRALLQQHVAERFARADVACWYGSMGGHAAWKFALEFGWRAIVFNPQTDLDLWAAFRRRERPLLWAAQDHARLADWPRSAWERVPLYLACGAATADRAAFSAVLPQLRRCRQLDAVIEKFDDADHAGLMNRIAGGGAVAPLLARIDRRLQQLAEAGTGDGPGLEADAAAAFWEQLDAARALKVEIRVREGRLWWVPSSVIGTR